MALYEWLFNERIVFSWLNVTSIALHGQFFEPDHLQESRIILHFQVFILDSLSNYDPKDENEAQSICDRVTPRLSHANSAVVLSCIKVTFWAFRDDLSSVLFLGIGPLKMGKHRTLARDGPFPSVRILSLSPNFRKVISKIFSLWGLSTWTCFQFFTN